jgi:deubiquitinase DESI2
MQRRVNKRKVYLNLYDLAENNLNSSLIQVGLGFFHSGVEIDGTEYTFSQSGIYDHVPMQVPYHFRAKILLGESEITPSELRTIISKLQSAPEWQGSKYDLLTCNCNHFSDALVVEILRIHIPSFVNRASYIGSFFRCLMPRQTS